MSGSDIRGGERLRMPLLFLADKRQMMDEKGSPTSDEQWTANPAYSFVFLKSLEKSPKTKEKRVDAGLKL